MNRTLVLNVVGLTPALIGPNTPFLEQWADRNKLVPLQTITPAVTCSVHATFMTGLPPSGHGAVGNGWYFRDLESAWLWRQSDALVQGEKVWETARRKDPRFTCAKLFWWFNMYGTVDWAVTPRPIYRADGRKLPDIHTAPGYLRDDLQRDLGPFPLFKFWGPGADIESTSWIARSAQWIEERHQPTLSLVYLPHLDYNLQRLGPEDPRIARDLRAVDDVCAMLIERAERAGTRVMVVSEYGMTPVRASVPINRVLREAGLIAWREEEGEEHLDPGASQAFAIADHQVAHVYVRDRARVPEVKALLEGVDGIDVVLDDDGKRGYGLDHPRSGELVAISRPDRWFSYGWWLDARRAPDYARTVDIHRKPGYDPLELFVDPKLPLPKLYIAGRLFQSKVLNVRSLLDVVPLDESLVRGSHGRVTDKPEHGPVLISNAPSLVPDDVRATDVAGLMLAHLFDA